MKIRVAEQWTIVAVHALTVVDEQPQLCNLVIGQDLHGCARGQSIDMGIEPCWNWVEARPHGPRNGKTPFKALRKSYTQFLNMSRLIDHFTG